MARWLSPDWDAKSSDPVPYAKLDEPQTLNLYGYLANNPLGGVDADGHQWSWDKTKTVLDVAGFIPVVGDVANAASGAISLAQGHYGEAALSFAAAVPVLGVLGEIGKGAELAKEVGAVVHAEKEVGAAVHATEGVKIAGEELAGKTRSEIRDLAGDKGLVAKGDTSHPDYPRKWSDPATNEERLRLDRGHVDQLTGKPFDNPNAAVDHVHGYDTGGKPIKVNGDKHIPTTGE